jgi:Sugar transferases involved in lipopolysaccharide synthesis
MKHRASFYEKYIKRLLDIIMSGFALIVLLPVLLVTAILVRIKLGSPVIFCQERPGKDEKIIKLYKFRSMTNEKDANGNLLPDEQRLSAFGRKLRATSLDELPSLVNIFRGDLSVVGPRPLLVKYLPLYNDEQHHRHDVRPGLTGLAQINGRNGICWNDKFKYDLYYIDHISFAYDIKIIANTVMCIIRHVGINAEGIITMREFTGSGTVINE